MASDLSRSASAFSDVVWPRIGCHIGGGQLTAVESVTATGFAKTLDVLSGIDGWQANGNSFIRGVASRVQWIKNGTRVWNTFTIRKSRNSGATTEYEKRLYAIDNREKGFLYPHITIQAFLRDGTDEFLSAAAMRTSELFNFVRDDMAKPKDSRVCWEKDTTNATFIAVRWSAVRESGLKIVIVANDQ